MSRYIKADKFFLKSGMVGPGFMEVIDGKFGQFLTEVASDATVTDYTGKWIAPGLVDTHIHGFKDQDVMDNSAEGLKIMSEGLLSCGVTSFLPTTLTSSRELLKEVAQTIGETYQDVKGAKVQGIYFEGPFFTEEHKGAQNPIYFSDPDLAVFNEWQEASGGLIKKIALAPERNGVADFVKAVTEQGVVVSLGHSSATFVEAQKAVEAGASVFVHTYNGMRGLHHREPGMVGAAMNLHDVYAELIADGHHVHRDSMDILMRTKGHDHIALITDCMMAGGMPDGDYMLGEFPVVKANGTVRLTDGNLAGSILELKEGLKNVVDWGLATPEQAVMMASLIPAVSCNIDDKCGLIAEGRDADFIVLSKEMDLEATYLNGELRYEA